MRRALPPGLSRRPLLLAALAMPAAAHAQGIAPADAPRRMERWRDLNGAIFGDRAVEAPVVVSSSLSQTELNLSNGPVTFTVTAHITDASGVTRPYMDAEHAETGQRNTGTLHLVSGDTTDGIFEGTITIQRSGAVAFKLTTV